MEKERSKLLDFLDGYEIPKENKNDKGEPITGKSFFSRSLSGSLTGRIKLSSSKFFEAIKTGTRRFLFTSARVYGMMLLTFGALSTVIALASEYFDFGQGTQSALISGLVFAILGIIFMFSESPIGNFAENFFLTDYLVFEFFCIKRMPKNHGGRGFAPAFGIIAGVILAAIGAWVHPLRVILVLGLLLFVALSFASPEFSFLFTILVLPYTEFIANTTFVLGALLITAFIAFLRKVISGKRVYVFEKYDFLIGIMIIFVLISGIFIKGMESFESSVMLVLGALGYILTSNLVTNRRLADRVSTAVALSSLPASAYVITTYVLSVAEKNYIYSGSGFYSSSVFGAFIIIAFLLTFSMLKEAKYATEQALLIFLLFIQAAALVCSASLLAAAVLLLGVLCHFLMKLRKFSGSVILLLILLAYAVFLLPKSILDTEAFTLILGRNASDTVSLWKASFKMFADHPLIGVGMGAISYSEEIVKYGAYAENNSSNLFLEIACEAGIFALLFFLLVIFTCLRHRTTYRSYVRLSQVKTISNTAMITFVCLILYGTVNYIWEHSAICYLFWCVFGLGSATLRIAKREYDDKIIYYNDVVSSESSDIDVQIDGFGE